MRGPVLAPLYKGSEYSNYGSSYEQFMMGWNLGLETRYGVSKNLALVFSGNFTSTYDNAAANSDQSFKLNNSDEAELKLKGLLRFHFEGNYYFLSDGNVQPYLIAGLGIDMWKGTWQNSGDSFGFTDLGGKFGAGICFWLSDKFSIDLQGRMTYGLTNLSADENTGYGNTDWSDFKTRPFGGYLEPSIGFTYFIKGEPDTDGDGIKDKFDQCHDTPAGALVDEYGCPLDTDGDGIFDGIDACDDTPDGAIVDITGCPLDIDQDGVFDGIDRCANTPLGIEVDVNGCPLDDDKDGVPDFKDKDLETPAGAIVDENGIAIDTDNDGIADGIDKCNDTPMGIPVDEYGCPKAKPLTDKIILNIKYTAGSSAPDGPAKAILDELVLTMAAYPDLSIEINGYTDALGSSSGNKKISRNRARAVMEYLVNKGVSADRMTATGYGEDPKYVIGDNSTPEGRQQNRRVEIVPAQ
jgi:outer membrane protein OmpA-like peptidoglycan-associated protein